MSSMSAISAPAVADAEGQWHLREDSAPVREEADEVEAAALTNVTDSGHHEYIKRLSDLLKRHDAAGQELSLDERRLQDCLREPVEHAYGIGLAEVYLLNHYTGNLCWIGGYCKPESLKTSVDEEASSSNNGKIVLEEPVDDVVPGTDLVGTLWSTVRVSTMNSGRQGLLLASSTMQSSNISISERHHAEPPMNGPRLKWRDLASLISDPDTSTSSRLERLAKAGLICAAGCPVEQHGVTGFVVFYALKSVSFEKRLLKTVANETFLIRSASYIGSCVAMTEARQAWVAFHSCCHNKTAASVKRLLEGSTTAEGEVLCSVTSCVNGEKEKSSEREKEGEVLNHFEIRNTCDLFRLRVLVWYNKCWGGGLQIPPPMKLAEVAWTILGAFCGLLVLSLLNEMFLFLTNEQFYLVIGPFGALMTLQYSLTAAPASQPRNVILGQCIAGAVSMSFTYIPVEYLPVWVRVALAPAFAIGAMTAAGVPHPPAGAHSVLWASGETRWTFYLIVVLGAIVSVAPATIVNNMNEKRQYPTYWGYIPRRLYLLIFGKDEEKDKMKGT